MLCGDAKFCRELSLRISKAIVLSDMTNYVKNEE